MIRKLFTTKGHLSFSLMTIFFCFVTNPLSAVESTKIKSRLQMDWAKQKLSFYGEAQQVEGSSLKQTENLARVNAQDWIKKDASEDVKKILGVELDTQGLEKLKSASSVNTVYSADKKVRVYFEIASSELWNQSSARVGSRPVSTDSYRNTGIAIKVKGLKAPLFSYSIVDETGQTLFDASKVKPDSFAKRQLGTWKRQISSPDVKQILGQSPVEVEAKISEDGKNLVIQRKDWLEYLSANEGILGESKQVLVFGM